MTRNKIGILLLVVISALGAYKRPYNRQQIKQEIAIIKDFAEDFDIKYRNTIFNNEKKERETIKELRQEVSGTSTRETLDLFLETWCVLVMAYLSLLYIGNSLKIRKLKDWVTTTIAGFIEPSGSIILTKIGLVAAAITFLASFYPVFVRAIDTACDFYVYWTTLIGITSLLEYAYKALGKIIHNIYYKYDKR